MKTNILSFTMGCLCISGAWAQITLVEGVNPTITFDTLPTMAQGWSTIPMAGAAGNLTTQPQMDTYVNTVSAANAVALVAATANPPGATGNGGYDPATQRLYTRPTGVNAASLLARVQNTVGADLNSLTIAFDLLNPITAAEEIPPYAVYYSFTGAANSWTLVPQLSGSTLGTHAFQLNFPTAWTAGATLYILWADDNASPSPDALFELNNVVFTVPPSRAATPPAYDFSIGASISPGFSNPRGLAVDRSGNLYVADTGNNRIVKFTGKGQFLMAWGGAGNTDGQFSSPLGIAVDSHNNVYVADSGNNRIQKFTSTGAYVTQWTCTSPIGVAVDSQNRVCVSGNGIETVAFSPWTGATWTEYVGGVSKFAGDGTVLQQWTIDTTPFAEAAYWGSGGWSVHGLVVDRNDNVYVAFDYYYRDPTGGGGWTRSWRGGGIEKLTSDGTYVSAWGNFVNYSLGTVVVPEGLAVDSANNLYVADLSNNQLEKFTSSGTNLTQWGIAGGALGQLSGPQGMAMDRSGNFLYVADSGNNRILVFAYRPTLNIQPISANTTIASWSTAASGFKLQTTTNLTPPVTWVDVANPTAMMTGQLRITNTASSVQFFRLKKL